jgi:CysZ protein
VVLRSAAWSIACFAILHIATIWAVHRLLDLHGILAWTADILGSVGASLLTLWLFLPVAAAIGTFYFDRIALAVERRFYPELAAPHGAPLLEQCWDGIAVGLRVLLLNVVALLLAMMLPGIGLVLGWMIAAFAIGRGFFVAVAMRRMTRAMAESLYRSRRGTILAQGALLAAATYMPVLNLLIPVIGVAAMIHILDSALGDEVSAQARLPRTGAARY